MRIAWFNPHESLVANTRPRPVPGRNAARFARTGTMGLTSTTRSAPSLSATSKVAYPADAAVDVVTIANSNRAVEERQRRRRAALARPERRSYRSAEEHAIAESRSVSDDAQTPRQTVKAVRDPAPQKEFFEEPLEGIEGEKTGRHRVVEAIRAVPEVLRASVREVRLCTPPAKRAERVTRCDAIHPDRCARGVLARGESSRPRDREARDRAAARAPPASAAAGPSRRSRCPRRRRTARVETSSARRAPRAPDLVISGTPPPGAQRIFIRPMCRLGS